MLKDTVSQKRDSPERNQANDDEVAAVGKHRPEFYVIRPRYTNVQQF
jgi:hypothetical protein